MSLEIRNLGVAFGGLQALQGVDMTLPSGKVTALIGPNGAGKSTFVNCITGHVTPSTGHVEIDGVSLDGIPAHRRVQRGLARSFQTPRVELDRTLYDNVLVGSYADTRSPLVSSVLRTPGWRNREQQARDRASAVIERFELSDVMSLRASQVPVWMLRLVEVARAIAMEPSYLMLDEPAAGVDDEYMERLGALIRQLAADGVGVLLIEHHFHFVRETSDRVIVLDRGKVLAEGEAVEIETDPRVIETYLGGGEA